MPATPSARLDPLTAWSSAEIALWNKSLRELSHVYQRDYGTLTLTSLTKSRLCVKMCSASHLYKVETNILYDFEFDDSLHDDTTQ